MFKKSLTWLIPLALVFVALFVVWSNRYSIYDNFVLNSYSPNSDISQLSTASGMNSSGSKLFYTTKPRISDKAEFATECKNDKEQTIVLGCFASVSVFGGLDVGNIYLYNVTDPRLAGVKEVTAAHEMLHAAYGRLSLAEKNKVDKLTAEAFARVNNPRIVEIVDNYRKQDPSVVPNELHSILGTEVANLGPELEAYYQKYFADRSKVVSLSQNYEKVMNEYKDQVDKIDADLSLRKAEIDSLETKLNSQSNSLNESKKQLNEYLRTGQTAIYNQQVPNYNSEVNSYNLQLASYRNLLDEYNQLVDKRNSIATEQQTLIKGLDSRVNAINP